LSDNMAEVVEEAADIDVDGGYFCLTSTTVAAAFITTTTTSALFIIILIREKNLTLISQR